MIIQYGLHEIAELHKEHGLVRQFIIGKSAEKLSSFQFGRFIFRDSLPHLGCSLERAVDNLIKSRYTFPICEKVGLHPILRQKGVYPYKCVDSIQKFACTEVVRVGRYGASRITAPPASAAGGWGSRGDGEARIAETPSRRDDEATRRWCDKPKLTRFKERVDKKRQPPWTARKKSWKSAVKRSS
jgi:hypothetical protein